MSFFPQGKFWLFVLLLVLFLFACFFFVVFVCFRCFRREARWVFEVSLFPQGTLCRQLNHSRDCKTNHSTTSPDARHVILRKQLSYSYVLDS